MSECAFCSYDCLNLIFGSDELSYINKNRTILEFQPGEHIFRQGAFISELMILRKGIIKKVIEGKNDKNTILKIVEGDKLIGVSLIGNQDNYPYSIVALTRSEVCVIRKAPFLSLLENNYKANQFFLEQSSKEFIFLFNQLSVISTRNSYGKLATVILYLQNGNFKSDVLNLLTRKELADLSSISVDSANKIIMQLKNDGIINIIKNKIIVKRPDLLEKLSTVG